MKILGRLYRIDFSESHFEARRALFHLGIGLGLSKKEMFICFREDMRIFLLTIFDILDSFFFEI
jgi:hypothetical protein